MNNFRKYLYVELYRSYFSEILQWIVLDWTLQNIHMWNDLSSENSNAEKYSETEGRKENNG